MFSCKFVRVHAGTVREHDQIRRGIYGDFEPDSFLGEIAVRRERKTKPFRLTDVYFVVDDDRVKIG